MAVVPYHLEYDARNVPLEQVIDSLRAQQKLLHEAVQFLSELAPGAELKIVGIRVNQIRSGSIIIDLLVEIYGFYQTDINNKIIHGIESLMGTDIPAEYETLLVIAVFAVSYFVARKIYESVLKKKESGRSSVHINGNYNNVINIVADTLVVSPQHVEQALEKVVHPSKFRQLVKPVVDFFRPAKSQPGTAIRSTNIEMPPEVFAEFPNEAEVGQLAQTEIIAIPDALIEIRALDKDRNKAGWAAKVVGRPEITDKRLPMDLYPTVDAIALAQNEQVRADLVVEMVRNSKGDLVAKRLHLLAFRQLEGASDDQLSQTCDEGWQHHPREDRPIHRRVRS